MSASGRTTDNLYILYISRVPPSRLIFGRPPLVVPISRVPGTCYTRLIPYNPSAKSEVLWFAGIRMYAYTPQVFEYSNVYVYTPATNAHTYVVRTAVTHRNQSSGSIS